MARSSKRRCRDSKNNDNDRNLEQVLIDIAKAFRETTDAIDPLWESKRFNGDVQYDLTCSFEPMLTTSSDDPQIDTLSVFFALIRTRHNARPITKSDGFDPNSEIVLSQYKVDVEKIRPEGKLNANGVLRTNVVDYILFGKKTHMTFEGCNYAKIVMYTAIMTLAKAKVFHEIHCASGATEQIMNMFSDACNILATKRGLALKERPVEHDTGTFWMYARGCHGTDSDATPENQWQLLFDAAKSTFLDSLTSKFKVEAALPSPYLVSSTSSYFLFL